MRQPSSPPSRHELRLTVCPYIEFMETFNKDSCMLQNAGLRLSLSNSFSQEAGLENRRHGFFRQSVGALFETLFMCCLAAPLRLSVAKIARTAT
jgi:hypothetical protein